MAQRFYIETLGCPKNDVDSDKLVGALLADGMESTDDAADADLVVVNTCAFIDDARRESIDTILALDELRMDGSRLVVTGCMAERYGDELAAELPEVDQVAGFGQSFTDVDARRRTSAGRKLIPVSTTAIPTFDLLNLPRPKSAVPWAYVKIAEGCDRSCGFCAIPSFRGPQRSRDVASILDEVEQLEAREIVLVAQDLASYGKDRPGELGAGSIVPLVEAVAAAVDRVRLLYLYPSDLSDALIDVICDSGVPYFDLSLQHVSKPLLRRMRRWGDGQRFLDRIADIRDREPDAAFRSNFIVGYPGETEADHDQLLDFVEQAQLDWCGFFSYSREDGTYAADLDGAVDPKLMNERLAELRELQDDITATRRDALIGSTVSVLVDAPGVGRTHREAPGDRRHRARRRGCRRWGASPRSRSSTRSGPIWSPRDSIWRCSTRRTERVAVGERLMVESSQIATWANAVTVGRLLLSPLMFWVIPNHQRGSWIAFVLWLIFCLSDGIDGWIARRHGVTSAGAFLDPLADKVLVLGAMFTLVSIGVFWVVPGDHHRRPRGDHQRVPGDRRRARASACRRASSAKYKTVCQQLAVGFALLPLTALDATWLWNGFLWAAVVLALISGTQYLWAARQMRPIDEATPVAGQVG